MDIYVVRGEASQLKRFQAGLGAEWQGGKFLKPLSSESEHRYWAYPTRSARDARAFIFGAAGLQLNLDIEAYDEAKYYPRERAAFDAIAVRCGLKSDALFLEPDRTLVLKLEVPAGGKAQDCVRTEVSKTDAVREIAIRPDYDMGERG